MENYIDVATFDIKRFAESLVKYCQEGVKWERRKLEWILEKRRSRVRAKAKLLEPTGTYDRCWFQWMRQEYAYLYRPR